jgi:hypothetical protein
LNIEKHILATLAYFSLFDYPITRQEIVRFLGRTVEQQPFEEALDRLIHHSFVFAIGNYLSVVNDRSLAERRARGNERAANMMRSAQRAASLISCFPFVKAVAISGSLSKNFADEWADVDFFIITAPNRLWTCRTLLHLFKKLTFLARRQHLFCMNYFIDENHPVILEKNIYTATEALTIIPARGSFNDFYNANDWAKTFLPNLSTNITPPKKIIRTWARTMVEFALHNTIGDRFDNFLMNVTAKRWNAKTLNSKRNSKGNILTMHAGKHFSKPGPENFQRHLLRRYEKSITELFNRYDAAITARRKQTVP